MDHTINPIEDSVRGPILLICFRNAHGASVAAPVGEVIARIISERSPAGLVLDFTNAEYSGGDGMCGVVVALGRKVPTAIMCSGGTGAAIDRTLRTTRLLDVFGGKVFPAQSEALEYLRERVSASG